MDPMTIGAIASGAGSLLSGLGSFSSNGRQNRDTNAWFQKQQFVLQKDFEKDAIVRRVKDAKNAGLHPLYALGAQSASVGSGPVVSAGSSSNGMASSGQALQGIGNSISAYQQAKQNKSYNNLLNKKLEAEINETNARTGQINAYTSTHMSDFIKDQAQASVIRKLSNRTAGIGQRNTPDPTLSTPFGTKWSVKGGRATAENMEELYDSLISLPYGALSFIEDLGANVARSPAYEKYIQPKSDWLFKNYDKFKNKKYNRVKPGYHKQSRFKAL